MHFRDTPPVSRRTALRTLALGAAGAALAPARLLAAPALPITVYKDASCTCCDGWVNHLRAAGWTVDVHTEPSLATLQERKAVLGVPAALRSCHTAVLALPAAKGRAGRQYVVEGHVPAAALARLVRERPDLAGLAVPDMPSGPPGMELAPGAPDAPPYRVLAFTATGAPRTFGEYPALRRTTRG